MVTKRIYKGVINGIGDGFVIDAVQTTYSYVELSDGQIIKKLIASMGINAKLREACKSAEPIELHVWPSSKRGEWVLLAVRMGDGKLFATDSIHYMAIQWWVAAFVMGCGIATIWALIGIAIIVFAVWLFKLVAFKRQASRYIASLTGAVLI